MDHLLKYAYLTRRCHHCGDQFDLTLYHVLQEHRLEREWQGGRPCDACHSEWPAMVEAVPRAELEGLAQAWDALRSAIEGRSLELRMGEPDPRSD